MFNKTRLSFNSLNYTRQNDGLPLDPCSMKQGKEGGKNRAVSDGLDGLSRGSTGGRLAHFFADTRRLQERLSVLPTTGAVTAIGTLTVKTDSTPIDHPF